MTTITQGASATISIPVGYTLETTGAATLTYGPGRLSGQPKVLSGPASVGPFDSQQIVYITAGSGFDFHINNPADSENITLAAGKITAVMLQEGESLSITGLPGAAGVASLPDTSTTWAIRTGALSQIGPYANAQRVLITCSAGSVEAAVGDAVASVPKFTTPAATPISSHSLSALRYEALSKPLPSSANGLAFNQTASLSALKFTSSVKKEEEVHFDAFRLVAVNRAVSAIGALTALVGTTETAAVSTSALLSTPTIGGTSYGAVQGSTDVNGFRAVTWGGAASTAIDAANAAQQVVLSDWVAKSSVPRADGGTRPLSLVRAFVDGTLTPVAFQSNYTAALQAPTAPMRNRIIQSANAIGTDAVLNPAASMTAATLGLEVFPILRFRTPVFSLWLCSDSIGANDGLVADKISAWGLRACADLSTPARPVVWSNMAASSQASASYTSILRTFLAAGVPAPSCLVFSPASVNDAGYDANFQEKHSSQAIEAIKLCADYKIPYLIMYPWMPNDSYTLAQDNIRKATNAKNKAIALAAGVLWVEFPTLGNGASPEKWVTEYRFDNVHPNETAIEQVMRVNLAAVLSPLI